MSEELKLTTDGEDRTPDLSRIAVPSSIMPSLLSIHGPAVEVMRIGRDGVWVNPELTVDAAAKAVLDALDKNIRVLVQRAVEEEREQCAKVCEETLAQHYMNQARPVNDEAMLLAACADSAAAIRSRT